MRYLKLCISIIILIRPVNLYMIPISEVEEKYKQCGFNYDEYDNLYNFYQNKHSEEKSILDKIKSVTNCFKLNVFFENDDFIKLPFEKYIDDAEKLIIDFGKFYINYISTTLRTMYNWKLTKLFLNPGIIISLIIYFFYRKMLLPIKERIEYELDISNYNSEMYSNCAINGNNAIESTINDKNLRVYNLPGNNMLNTLK